MGASQGYGQHGARRGFLRGGPGGRGAGGRGGARGRGVAGGGDCRGHARLRQAGSDARHDAQGGQVGARAGPEGPDAEPQGRHGLARRGAGGGGAEGGQGRVPGRQAGDRARGLWQNLLLRGGPAENLGATVQAIQANKPTGAKGDYFKSMYVVSTMGPSMRVDPSSFLD